MLPRLPLLPPPPTRPAFDGSPASACCVIYTQHHPTNAATNTSAANGQFSLRRYTVFQFLLLRIHRSIFSVEKIHNKQNKDE